MAAQNHTEGAIFHVKIKLFNAPSSVSSPPPREKAFFLGRDDQNKSVAEK